MGKKKGGSKSKAVARPPSSDRMSSLVRDINAVKSANPDATPSSDSSSSQLADGPPGGTLDLADELLASLDERDEAERKQKKEEEEEEEENKEGNEKNGFLDAVKEAVKDLKPTDHQQHERGGEATRKPNRHRLRMERKAAAAAAERAAIEAEVAKSGGTNGALREQKAIDEWCASLGVRTFEISPDGHCLYAAVADQLNINGFANPAVAGYQTTRRTAAEYMRAHPDEFKPFLSAEVDGDGTGDGTLDDRQYAQYCDTVENTGEWGGQPEILALSRAYGVQIHIVQADSPIVKVGEGEQPLDGDKGTARPLRISYHRHMYGLGEHYNSLRPV